MFDVLKPGGCFIFGMNTYLRLSTVGKEAPHFDGSCYFAVWLKIIGIKGISGGKLT